MRQLELLAPDAADRHVEGLVDAIRDATTGSDQPLDQERLCRWQSALFPGGKHRGFALCLRRDFASDPRFAS